jgi:hypothetical protein
LDELSKWALLWVGGDVGNYEKVRYLYGDDVAETFLAAEALRRLLPKSLGEFEYFHVFIPETLFEDNHCENYRLLIRAKAGCNGLRLFVKLKDYEDATKPDNGVCELAELLEERGSCSVVPHPGRGRPLVLKEYNDPNRCGDA